MCIQCGGRDETSTARSEGDGSQKKVELLQSQSEEMVAAPKQLGVFRVSGSQSSHNARGLKEPIGPRRRPAGPYKYCIRAPAGIIKQLFRDSFFGRSAVDRLVRRCPRMLVDYR